VASLPQIIGTNYDAGRPPDLVHDVGVLEAHILENRIQFVFVDQILDHVHRDRNAHGQHDMRQALAPVRSLARRLDIAVLYSIHTNKSTLAHTTRERAGGSGQLTDLPRSVLEMGWHPERENVRVVAHGAGNRTPEQPAICFQIKTAFVRNPATGEEIDVGVISDMETDPELTAEEIETKRPKKPEESKYDRGLTALRGLGADGQWRTRKEAQTFLEEQGIARATFERIWEALKKETRSAGREIEWRLN
jgi:hypothetical protein